MLFFKVGVLSFTGDTSFSSFSSCPSYIVFMVCLARRLKGKEINLQQDYERHPKEPHETKRRPKGHPKGDFWRRLGRDCGIGCETRPQKMTRKTSRKTPRKISLEISRKRSPKRLEIISHWCFRKGRRKEGTEHTRRTSAGTARHLTVTTARIATFGKLKIRLGSLIDRTAGINIHISWMIIEYVIIWNITTAAPMQEQIWYMKARISMIVGEHCHYTQCI